MTASFFTIEGINPEPWTAPTAHVSRRNGRLIAELVKDAAVTVYQEAVREAVLTDYSGVQPVSGPVSVSFYLWRQIAAYEGKRGTVRKHAADATNLQKSLEDALQGVLYENDRQVVHAETWIMEQDQATEPLIVVELLLEPRRPPGVRRTDSSQPRLTFGDPEKWKPPPVEIDRSKIRVQDIF